MNYIITIGREYGSGGRIIGESLAAKPGINYMEVITDGKA